MSRSNVAEQPQTPPFQSEEDTWFVISQRRDRKRPLRTSPTTPPPPIGDALADGWFR